MGRSDKPDIGYTFADHARYLDAWFDALGLDDVVLVGHDWGGALAFDHAARHPGRVRGLAFFETIVKPMAWDDLSPQAAERSKKIRTPGIGEDMVLTQDLFIRQAFTGGVRTPVGEDDLAAYLAPFPTPESRRPVLAWARQLPLGGEPAELVTRIEAYDEWLATSTGTPKLLMTFDGSPTLLIGERMTALVRGEHRRAGRRRLRGGRAPRAGGPAQGDRRRDLRVAGPARPPLRRQVCRSAGATSAPRTRAATHASASAVRAGVSDGCTTWLSTARTTRSITTATCSSVSAGR